jgi:hypothetical protein
VVRFDEAPAGTELGAKTTVVLRGIRRHAQLPPLVFEQLLTRCDARIRVLKTLGDAYFDPAKAWSLLEYLIGDDGSPLPRPADASLVTERAFEEYLQSHWDQTPFHEQGVVLSTLERGFASRQVLTPVNSIDLLGFDPKNRTWWVFELKRGRPPDAVVGQVSRYLGWISAARKQAGEKAVGVVLSQGANPKLKYAIEPHPSLSLWIWDKEFRIRRSEDSPGVSYS